MHLSMVSWLELDCHAAFAGRSDAERRSLCFFSGVLRLPARCEWEAAGKGCFGPAHARRGDKRRITPGKRLTRLPSGDARSGTCLATALRAQHLILS